MPHAGLFDVLEVFPQRPISPERLSYIILHIHRDTQLQCCLFVERAHERDRTSARRTPRLRCSAPAHRTWLVRAKAPYAACRDAQSRMHARGKGNTLQPVAPAVLSHARVFSSTACLRSSPHLWGELGPAPVESMFFLRKFVRGRWPSRIDMAGSSTWSTLVDMGCGAVYCGCMPRTS